MAPKSATAIRGLSGQLRDQLQSAVTFGVVVTARLWRARFADRMKPLDQSDARRTVLSAIAAAPQGVIQTQLAEQIGIQAPTLVRLLDALEKQGLVKRCRASTDRPAKLIGPKGREVLAEANSFAAKLQNEMFSGVCDADLTTTARVLENLTEHLGPTPAAR